MPASTFLCAISIAAIAAGHRVGIRTNGRAAEVQVSEARWNSCGRPRWKALTRLRRRDCRDSRVCAFVQIGATRTLGCLGGRRVSKSQELSVRASEVLFERLNRMAVFSSEVKGIDHRGRRVSTGEVSCQWRSERLKS